MSARGQIRRAGSDRDAGKVRRTAPVGENMTSARHQQLQAPVAHTDILVLDYLAALWGATEDLPDGLRDDLLSTVADHIAVRRAAGQDDTERVLRLLGDPEDLAAAARRGRIPAHVTMHIGAPVGPPTDPRPAQRSAAAEYWAVGLLTAGSLVVPVAGPLAGLVLTGTSGRLTRTHKTIAMLLAVGPAFLSIFVGMALAALGALEASLMLFLAACLIGPVAAGLSLLPGIPERRPEAEPTRSRSY